MLIDRYFLTTPQHFSNYQATLMSDNDVLPILRHINAFPVYEDEKKVIVKVRLDRNSATVILDMVDTDTPFAPDTIAALGIMNAYLGETLDDVYARFPELDGVRQWVDEEGVEHSTPIVKDTVIA